VAYITNTFDDEVINLLKDGAVGFMPSDTIYGLSCVAKLAEAVERIHKLKDRDSDKPFIVLFSNPSQLNELGIESKDITKALKYWPGKLSFITEAHRAPEWLKRHTDSLAIRQPADINLLELIDKTGPIISTSANISGQEPANSRLQAENVFGDKLDFYVDVGQLNSLPSTIVRNDGAGGLTILRQGEVKL